MDIIFLFTCCHLKFTRIVSSFSHFCINVYVLFISSAIFFAYIVLVNNYHSFTVLCVFSIVYISMLINHIHIIACDNERSSENDWMEEERMKMSKWLGGSTWQLANNNNQWRQIVIYLLKTIHSNCSYCSLRCCCCLPNRSISLCLQMYCSIK